MGESQRARRSAPVPPDPLAVVERVAESLAAAHDVTSVAEAVVDAATVALDASAVMVGALEGSTVVPLVAVGLSESSQPLVKSAFEVEGWMPAHTVLESGEPVFWSSVAERDRDFPAYAGFPTEHGAWAILPLVSRGDRVGILALAWAEGRTFDEPTVALLRVVARQCAVALDRARLLAAEREAREISDLLAEGTRLMASALDRDEILRRLVGLAIPVLAPWCAVYVAEGSYLRRAAVRLGELTALSEAVASSPVVPLSAVSPLTEAYRSGETTFVGDAGREHVAAVYPDDVTGALLAASRTGRFSALVVPVKVTGRVMGVVSLVSDSWEGRPSADVVRAAEGLAARAGMALSVAGRFEQEHETAVVLTRALLPSEGGIVPGLETATRYLPTGGSVAGDWFDVVPVAPGRFLLGVGDSAGHGMEAASLMATLRNAARGLAVAGSSPAAVLGGLDWLVRETVPEGFATAQYLLAEPGTESIVWSSAGHLPPVFFDAAGARFVEAKGSALGVPAGERVDRVFDLPPGSGLVLYTDGVVERRRGDIADQLERLRELVSAHRRDSAEDVASAVMEQLCAAPEDDCCLLVLRRTALVGPGRRPYTSP